jgi:hypothetical protein
VGGQQQNLEEGRVAKILRFKRLTEKPAQHPLLVAVERMSGLHIEAIFGLEVLDTV